MKRSEFKINKPDIWYEGMNFIKGNNRREQKRIHKKSYRRYNKKITRECKEREEIQ